MTQRSISILGATGSIGASTLDLIRREKDKWRVVALTANSNAEELAKLARDPKRAVLAVTHDTRTIDFANRIVNIEDGKIKGERKQKTKQGALRPEPKSSRAARIGNPIKQEA